MNLKNIKCGLGVSKIHGIGVFALKDIKQGEKLYAEETIDVHQASEINELDNEIKKYIISRWPTVLEGKEFCYPFEITVCYMNHSDTPNYNQYTDTANHFIRKGEEITEDYGEYRARLLEHTVKNK